MHWIDHTHLPKVSGRIAAILHNQHGERDGALLDKGREVHIPPHLAAQAGRALTEGERLSVRYLRPRGADVFVAVALDLPSGKQIVDEGPDGREPPLHPQRKPVHMTGQVRARIHAPRGETHGALLEDGTIVRFHPKGNEELESYFEPGARIEVWGEGFKKSGAWVIELEHVAQAA